MRWTATLNHSPVKLTKGFLTVWFGKGNCTFYTRNLVPAPLASALLPTCSHVKAPSRLLLCLCFSRLNKPSPLVLPWGSGGAAGLPAGRMPARAFLATRGPGAGSGQGCAGHSPRHACFSATGGLGLVLWLHRWTLTRCAGRTCRAQPSGLHSTGRSCPVMSKFSRNSREVCII